MLRKIIRQYQTWKPSMATKNILYHLLTHERKTSFGDANPDKIFYVIRSIAAHSRFYTGPVHNLLANYFYVLSHLQYAKLQGWIPIVDQLHYPVYNSQSEPIHGTKNPWEYFWQQPCSFTLEEVYQSRHVVLSKQNWFGQWDMGYAAKNYVDSQMVAQFHHLSEIVPLKDGTSRHIRAIRDQLLPAGKRVLGVSFRFGGHAKNCPYPGSGHPIQPEVDELIAIVQHRLAEWDMECIFFASDENKAVDAFRKVFGDKVQVLPRTRCEANEPYNAVYPNPMYAPGHLYHTTLDYLTEMELLSRCNGLIGSITSGLRYAVVRNGGIYEKIEILDRGLFPDKRKNRDENQRIASR